MNNKTPYYLLLLFGAIIAVLSIMLAKHECRYIEVTTTRYDTAYLEQEPRLVFSSPVNIPYAVEKLDTIKVPVITKADTVFKIVYVQRFEPQEVTFTSTDTLYSDSLGIAIKDKGNCLGILDRQATFFGKQKQITKTVTNNIATPPQTFSLYGGVSNQITNKTTQDVTPNAMLLYKGKIGLEYGYGVLNNSHNIGLKFKIK